MAYMRFPRLRDLKDPKERVRFVLLSGALFLVAVFITALGLPLTSNPSLCGNICHGTTREYYAWKKSSHSNVPCAACHSNLGQVAFFYEKVIDGPKYIYAELTKRYKRPINADSHFGFERISRQVCERCHNLRKRKVTPSLRFSKKMVGKGFSNYHFKHLKRGIPCTLCHNRITHKKVNDSRILKLAGYSKSSIEARTDYKDGLKMIEGCFRCHSAFGKERNKELIKKYKASNAPKSCTTCHDKPLLPVGHGKNWIKTHPKMAKKLTFEFCYKCHGRGKRFDSLDGKRSQCRDCHHRIIANKELVLKNCKRCHEEMALAKEKLVDSGVNAMRKLKDKNKAQYFRRIVYHKVHFAKKYKCTKCHLADLETTKKPPFELCKNKGCHPPGQIKPPSGSKLCKQCHISPHSK